MKGGANIIGSVHALKQAHDHLISFRNEHPGTKGAKLAAGQPGIAGRCAAGRGNDHGDKMKQCCKDSSKIVPQMFG